ncbi:MAG: hypothetical protein AAGB48_13310 [Planctomycetota bacterium]
MHRPPRTLIATASLAIAGHAAAQSDDLFVFDLVDTGNPSNTLTVGGSSLPDLLTDLGDTTGDFSSFDGVPFDATITYAGIDDAIEVTYDPTGGTGGGELVIITNLLGNTGSFTFDEIDGDLGEQLEDFFLQNDDEVIENFLATVAELSPVAVTDGNPLASTARSARYSFFRYGLFSDATPTDRELRRVFADPILSDDDNPGPAPATYDADALVDDETSPAIFSPNGTSELDYGGTRFRLDFRGQTIDAGGFDGSSFDVALSTEVRFSDRVSVIVGAPLAYHQVGDGDVFNAGINAGLPIRILIPDEDDDFGVKWQVTPLANIDTVFSYDLAAGGILYGFGLNNLLTIELGPVSLVTSQQYTVHESLALDANDVSLDPGVEQQILKLGGKLQWAMTDNVYIYGGGVWTDFLEDAAVDDYTTALAGFGLRTSDGCQIVLGYEGDFGDDYDAHGGALIFQLPF